MKAKALPLTETMSTTSLKVEDGYEFYKNVLKSPKYVVAPMVAQSELPWRMLARKCGANLCYTPMYNSRTMLMDKNYHKEVLHQLKCREDRPLVVQFCANSVENFVQASLIVQEHCNGVDLNLGCPQHIAQRGHYGAFLQDDWELIRDMISEARKQLHIGVSAKIRVFPEVAQTVAYAKMLEEAGCHLLAVHGRTRDQKRENTGLADWNQIKAVKNNLKIPVLANGNIRYHEDVARCLEETGVDGVMVAEGHLSNPYIFQDVTPNVYDVLGEYLALVETYPTSVSHVRTHAFNLLATTLEFHQEARDRLASACTVEDIALVCNRLRKTCDQESMGYGLVESTGLSHWLCQPYNKSDRQKVKKVNEEYHIDGDNGEVKLSKNQQKKLLKARHQMAKVVSKRKAEHERKKERIREERRMFLENDDLHKSRITRATERKQAVLERMEAAMRDDNDSIVVCLDLSWSHAMDEKEIGKLSNQLGRLYGSNRKCEKPAHLYFAGLDQSSSLWRECVRKHDGFADYKIDMTSQPYRDLFQSRDIIYLTPDAPTALQSVEPGIVYVLGGLVDETVTKMLTLDSATEAGITTRRLPVVEYMTRSGRHSNYSTVYCVNQVFDILITFHLTQDWKKALAAGIPPRKGYVIKNSQEER